MILESCAGGGAGAGSQAGALSALGDVARALRHAVRSVPELRMLDTDAPQSDQSLLEGGGWVSPIVVAGLAPLRWLDHSSDIANPVALANRTNKLRTVRIYSNCSPHHSFILLF